MRSSSDRFRIGLATPEDVEQVAAIYDSDDGFEGDISVKFTRWPNPLESLAADGDDAVVPVVRDGGTGQLVGMGACVLRDAWVDGEACRVGYLTGLKALPDFRGWVRIIPQVYDFLRESTPDVELYYTTILTENTLARKLLERERPGMPRYEFVGEYLTHCYRWNRPVVSRNGLRRGSVKELVALNLEPRNLAAVGVSPGVTDDDVWVLDSPDGEPLAWCSARVQTLKQYTITRYDGRYARLARLPVHWLGYPKLPTAGTQADYAVIGDLGARDDVPRLIRELLQRVGWLGRERNFLMVGLMRGNPYESALQGIRTINYSSRLYTVDFGGCRSLTPDGITLDVGLL